MVSPNTLKNQTWFDFDQRKHGQAFGYSYFHADRARPARRSPPHGGELRQVAGAVHRS
jgi:hypothetical protein